MPPRQPRDYLVATIDDIDYPAAVVPQSKLPIEWFHTVLATLVTAFQAHPTPRNPRSSPVGSEPLSGLPATYPFRLRVRAAAGSRERNWVDEAASYFRGAALATPPPHEFHGHPVGGMMPPQGGVHVPQQTSEQHCIPACRQRSRPMVVTTEERGRASRPSG